MKKKKRRKNEKMKKSTKNEKMKIFQKIEKNDEKRKKNSETWLHTQNPRRFPVFTVVVVVVVIFFVKILDDFHDCVSECVSFPRKINNPFWEVTVFPKKSDNFHWT